MAIKTRRAREASNQPTTDFFPPTAGIALCRLSCRHYWKKRQNVCAHTQQRISFCWALQHFCRTLLRDLCLKTPDESLFFIIVCLSQWVSIPWWWQGFFFFGPCPRCWWHSLVKHFRLGQNHSTAPWTHSEQICGYEISYVGAVRFFFFSPYWPIYSISDIFKLTCFKLPGQICKLYK